MMDRDDLRHFEDLSEGESIALGRETVTKEMIFAFARAYDPLPFHLDEDAARRSLLGGLAASGWQTAALAMGLFVRGYLANVATLGVSGFADLKWKRPVMAGDTIGGTVTLDALRPDPAHAGRGIAGFGFDVRNQKNEPVMTMRVDVTVPRRAPGAVMATPEPPYDVSHGGAR